MLLNNYECPHCGQFETWGSREPVPCPNCGMLSEFRPGTPGIHLDFIHEGFPRAYRRWAEQHERAGREPHTS